MSQHKHPASRKHFDSHRAAVRAAERTYSMHLDRLYRAARLLCLAQLDTLLQQMQQEQRRLAQHAGQWQWDTTDDEEEERPHVSVSWLDGPQGRLIQLTAHIEQTMTQFATDAGGLITRAHEQVTADGERAAIQVLAARSAPDSGQVHPLPVGTLAQMAGRVGNGQPVASLLDGVGRTTANEVARTLRVGVGMDLNTTTLRNLVRASLDQARNRAQTLLTDSLWRGNGRVMMAVYRANRRGV